MISTVSQRVSNPPDAGLYHLVHRVLLNCRSQRLLRLLLGVIFALESFYVNRLRPLLGLRYSEKYLAYDWILNSPLVSPGKRVLDIGCGDSLFPSKLAGLGYQSHAVDISNDGCIAARDSRVNFKKTDVCDMPFQSGAFDIIIAISALEHVEEDGMGLAVEEIGRVLKKDGIIFVTMPDCDDKELGHSTTMSRLLTRSFKVLSHEHHILTSKKTTKINVNPTSDVPQDGAGITFLLLSTLPEQELK
jgi:2-polyprenyl-3-methyl-5-hydroxy-6-metoxy-1,4-benzoquinol methylase